MNNAYRGIMYPHIKLEGYVTLQRDVLSKSVPTILVIMLISCFLYLDLVYSWIKHRFSILKT